MIDVYWLRQTVADLPCDDRWLSSSEAVCLDHFRFAKRRADWRLGRWTAKRAVAIYLGLRCDLSEIEIRPAASGAPQVFLENHQGAVSLSLSHSADTAICAVAPASVNLGCDLERIEPRSPEFVADYFSSEEQTLVSRCVPCDRPRLATLLWSAKESALKALAVGLRADTRSVNAHPVALNSSFCSSWQPLHVCHAGGQDFQGWWQRTDSMVQTLVASPSPAPPIYLALSSLT